MELIFNELNNSVEPKLCLNMIVKNESHIIKNTFDKLLQKVPFDYWVISDTGSTDNTKEVIINYFKEKNIKGELFDDEWKDFGHNRTKALEHAYEKSKYLFIFDADDEICGDFILPELTLDSYYLQFGDINGTSYVRTQFINNKKKWKYIGVLHEMITCCENTNGVDTIKGNYYTISGRNSDRNRDETKYLKDALILETAYEEAVKNKDEIYNRYGFYCANSYFDYGKYKEAIKWYKITLDNNNWSQEKYIACLRLYYCYNALNEKETGFFYLVKAFSYDSERVECLCELITYYCGNNMYEIAYGYYNIVKSFYNEKYLKYNLQDKLFLDVSKANFILPYYMILIADKMKDFDTVIQMYKILFTKKHIETNKLLLGNVIYNLQFFIERGKNDTEFIQLFKEYVDFLVSTNYPVFSNDFMSKYEDYGITIPKIANPSFTQDECLKSNKILFYTGYSPLQWNDTFSVTNALGGSETAIISLSKKFPKNYKIYVAGNVKEETVDNIEYVHLNNLSILINTTAFHTIVVSRYLNFYELYTNFSSYQTFIWGHDIVLFPYGTNLSVENILSKWSSKINGCVCQTEWHKDLFLSLYPQLNGKSHVINNGINTELFTFKNKKVSNRFIYTSCSERGLDRLVELWPTILENLPDAELFIASYNTFPNNDYEIQIKSKIDRYSNIKHVGKLNKNDLYNLMSSAEYWLYPTNFNETSCITSMEMLMSEVICIYYPVAGLVNTLGEYGIPIKRGQEVDTIVNLTNTKKDEIRKRGKEYALSCSWENRSKKWLDLLIKDSHNSFYTETNVNKYNIKIINLKKRTDRKEHIEQQLKEQNILNYTFSNATDGKELTESEEIRVLFERNDFNYRKGVIGCSLSHIKLWNDLINDSDNNCYVILEDDIQLCKNFKEKLDFVCEMFIKQEIEHLALGDYTSNRELNQDLQKLNIIEKDVYYTWNTAFSYIISKNAAKKIISYINNCSIKAAIDNPQAYGNIIKYYDLNEPIIRCDMYSENLTTDIQLNEKESCFVFSDNMKNNAEVSISFCDWWNTEYCGGVFDFNDNFITNILKQYGNISKVNITSPDSNPDILFYSIFGNQNINYKAGRKIFFSGEPYGARKEADYNLTFDDNTIKNTRLPLWLSYFSDFLLIECNKRKNNVNIIPQREKFCSFIATGPGLANNRQEFVESLSKYKRVDCGGSYLNNIGYNVPVGLHCSGKIEHNNSYKFAIAFESTVYPGYVTEKICDIYKSNCIPIYWGHPNVIKDFNPTTFINANDFLNFDELIKYIIKVDNNEDLYKSFFKEPMLKNIWLDIFSDPNKSFFKNLADNILGKNSKLLDNFNYKSKKTANIYNIWHNKLFDNCYEQLDTYSLGKINMYDVNPNYQKIYNKDKNYKIIKEYELKNYNNLLQYTNYCQTSCLYHVFTNEIYYEDFYIGFIQYDMELESNFIYDIEEKINNSKNDIFFYSLVAQDKLDRIRICNPYDNSILEKYNNYFNTKHTYDSIVTHKMSKYFICLHTFVIPTKIYIKMMNWYCSISDWLHINYVNGIYTESMSEVTEEIFGLFLLLQIIENDNIQLEELKLKHNWPNLHNETSFNNYKDPTHYFSLTSIINNNLTDKNTYHSYIDVYENLFKNRQLTTKNVLEIGIERGGSLKLWNDYFVNSQIYGLDINDAPQFLSKYKRIITQTRDAYSYDTLQFFLDKNIKFDVIIHDGPHTLENLLFVVSNYPKLLNKDGILIIEDIQIIEWCEILYNNIDTCLQEFSYNIDRRHIKGTPDDILFIVENKYEIQENKLEENKIYSKKNDLWVFYAFEGHNYKVIEDYINSLNTKYNIVYTTNIEYVLTCNPKKISYIMYIVNERILNKYKNSNVELSFLNTEPLSISYNLELLKQYINKYPYLKIYDYNCSNLQIFLNNNLYAELMEYQFCEKENTILKELNLIEKKIYDFGIITYGNTKTNTIDSLFYKKKDVVYALIQKGFKIHIISGWGIDRDKELAKCAVILNVHSILGINGEIYYSKTFENIRCNRLLDAGFKILSEDSVHCNDLTDKYRDNLKFIDYNDFKNIEYSENVWDKIENNRIKKYCFIHSCNVENVGAYRLDYLVDKLNVSGCVNIFEKIYINNIGLPIDNTYGEKFEVINYSENTQLYENPTINLIKDFSEKTPNSYILYLHTKGIRYSKQDEKENDWINYMLYFLVEEYKICISALDKYYDTVGCNYSNDLDKVCFKFTNPFPDPHYSGNFWWANTNYLRSLPKLSMELIERNAPEFWLFKNNPCFFNLHSSNVNHFHNIYERKLYSVN